MSVFKKIGRLLFGSGDKVQWARPEQLIAKPTEQEQALLSQLFPYSLAGFQRGQRIGQIAFGLGLPQQTARAHRQLYGQALQTMGQSLGLLGQTARGELPSSYMQAIERQFREDLGRILSRAASRGVINSSITKQAIADALQRTADLRVRYLPTVAQLAFQPARMAEGMYRFGALQPLGLLSGFRELERDYTATPLEMWNRLMSARYSVRAMPIVKRGQPGLIGTALSGLGGGLGFGLGGFIGRRLFGG